MMGARRLLASLSLGDQKIGRIILQHVGLEISFLFRYSRRHTCRWVDPDIDTTSRVPIALHAQSPFSLLLFHVCTIMNCSG